MEIKHATILNLSEVIDFFEEHLDKNNKAIYSEEFLCPFGIKGAISRQQIIITRDNNKIVAALRYYPRKKDNITSLYQFAIKQTYRKKQLLKQMLKYTKQASQPNQTNQSIQPNQTNQSNQPKQIKIIVQCPKEIEFNNYYKKTGWKIDKEDETYNFWKLEL